MICPLLGFSSSSGGLRGQRELLTGALYHGEGIHSTAIAASAGLPPGGLATVDRRALGHHAGGGQSRGGAAGGLLYALSYLLCLVLA